MHIAGIGNSTESGKWCDPMARGKETFLLYAATFTFSFYQSNSSAMPVVGPILESCDPEIVVSIFLDIEWI